MRDDREMLTGDVKRGAYQLSFPGVGIFSPVAFAANHYRLGHPNRATDAMVEAAGVELFPHSETAQVIDFAKLQKRENRYFRQFEVHGGYTEQSIPISSLATRGASL